MKNKLDITYYEIKKTIIVSVILLDLQTSYYLLSFTDLQHTALNSYQSTPNTLAASAFQRKHIIAMLCRVIARTYPRRTSLVRTCCLSDSRPSAHNTPISALGIFIHICIHICCLGTRLMTIIITHILSRLYRQSLCVCLLSTNCVFNGSDNIWYFAPRFALKVILYSMLSNDECADRRILRNRSLSLVVATFKIRIVCVHQNQMHDTCRATDSNDPFETGLLWLNGCGEGKKHFTNDMHDARIQQQLMFSMKLRVLSHDLYNLFCIVW